jgi:hypothetical protein
VKLVVGKAIARIVREVEELGGRVKDLAGDGVLRILPPAAAAFRGRRALDPWLVGVRQVVGVVRDLVVRENSSRA